MNFTFDENENKNEDEDNEALYYTIAYLLFNRKTRRREEIENSWL